MIPPEEWPAALAATDGPQLVLAGPGTGKTEFLARRAAHLIRTGAAEPEHLLVLTFSRRAAYELRTRIEDEVRRSMLEVPTSTFHSYCYRVLEFGGMARLPWSTLPTILTGPEQVSVIARLLSVEDPAAWPATLRPLLGSRTLAEEVAEFVLRSRERLLWGRSLVEVVAGRADWRALPRLLERYDAELVASGRIDYGTLQAATVEILEDPEIRALVAGNVRYVLVDEFQDTTVAQARLLELLVGTGGNLTVAADPWQSIYGFRGAAPSNVARFPARFPGARQIVLESSFRVPSEILVAAGRLLPADSDLGTPSRVAPARHPGTVQVVVFDQHSHEAEWIAAEILRLHAAEQVPYGSVAVLVRSKRRFLGELTRALRRTGIPHDEAHARLVDHPAVQACLDCVRLASLEYQAGSAPEEARPSLMREADRAADRVLLGPLFRLPLSHRREVFTARARDRQPWARVVAELVPEGSGLASLLADPSWAVEQPADEGFWRWWSTLPQIHFLVAAPAHQEMRAAWSSLDQALHRLVERDPSITLAAYAEVSEDEDYEAVPLLSFRGDEASGVVLTTLHQAKGLEFDVVFIADAVEGVFPDLRRERSILRSHLLGARVPSSPAEAISARLEEEARLAYVGMTRARRRVVWTATSAGVEEAMLRPSRFLHAVAGVPHAEDLPGPPPEAESPVTVAGLEALLRRRLRDPQCDPVRRLAAVALLSSSRRFRQPLEFCGVREPGPDHGVLPDDPRLSPSQADLYERCPYRYVLVRRLGIADDDNVYARFGSLIHQVLEAAERRAMERGEAHATLEEALQRLDRALGEYDFGWRGTTQAWRRRGVELLSNLYRKWPPPADQSPVDLERRLTLTIADVPWVGFADRIDRSPDGGLRVVDYKTSKSAPKPEDVSLQLGFYALAAAADGGLSGPVTDAQLWYPLAGADGVKVIPLDLPRLAEIERRLVSVTEAIRAEDWSPRPGPDCLRCPVRVLCPAWPEGREAFTS